MLGAQFREICAGSLGLEKFTLSVMGHLVKGESMEAARIGRESWFLVLFFPLWVASRKRYRSKI